jgi:hypothetical protein
MTTLSQPIHKHLKVRDLFMDRRGNGLTANALGAAASKARRPGTTAGGLGLLSHTARVAAHHEVGVAAAELLDLDLTEALVTGWLKYRALREAGRRTVGSMAREVVELVTHRITTSYTPTVDLFIDEVRVASFEFRLELTIDVVGCAAVVAAGQLVAVKGGDLVVKGTLSMEGQTIATRSKRFDAELVADLRRPVPLA